MQHLLQSVIIMWGSLTVGLTAVVTVVSPCEAAITQMWDQYILHSNLALQIC